MLLFRLVDLPRVVRRLTPSIPIMPEAEGSVDAVDAALRWVRVEWSLRPTLLNPHSRNTKNSIAEVLALYAEAEGRPRSAVEALAPRIEGILDDYRLARCLARTVEDAGYHFAPPPRALPSAPVDLRALCYRRAQERYGGYVPRAGRAAFVAALAAELEATPEQVEESLWSDRPGAALLRAGPAPTDTEAPASREGQQAATAALDPAHIIARYNAAAVATLLSASSWVTLLLPATETAALKSLYRHAKARHVGVEIALYAPSAEKGEEILALTLYGPGSRALVRGRPVRGSGGASEGPGRGEPADKAGDHDEARATVTGVGSQADNISVPAPGGPPVAAVVARLLQRHPRAVREGWTRLLGPDQRLFHVALDEASLTALCDAKDAEIGGDEAEGEQYDSSVEADFARAFHAAAAGGRLGVARGWVMEREPRVVIVGDSVFLPDFSFRRGEVEVLCEVVGYYTEDYLARKKRKLVQLGGQLPILLVVDGDLAPLFADVGCPLVTYKAGRQVGVAEVVQTLDASFDPFDGRRARGVRALAALRAAPGPGLSEEELCAAVGCAGPTELTALWSDLLAQEEDTSSWQRRYVRGYGLASIAAIEQAREALAHRLGEGDGPVSLEDVVALCARAGLPDADDALIAALGGVVVRSGLFGEALVYRPGDEADSALAALPAPEGRRRKRRA